MSAERVRTRRTWDLVLSIVLTIALLVLAVLLGFAGLFLVFASDSCGSSSTCAGDRLGAGVLLASIGPAVVAVVATAGVIVRLVLARLAFWVPVAGIVLASLVWAVGAALVFGAVTPS